MVIENGRAVVIGYELRLDSGNVVDSCTAADPLTFVYGAGLMLPAFENELQGKKKGDKLSFSLSADKGYGLRDENQVFKMPRRMFPPHVAEGMVFEAETPEGEHALLKVTSVGLEEVTVDGNHPMAGENLNFSVEVLDVREPTDEELSGGHDHGDHGDHGHDHGDGGCCGGH